VDCLTIYCKYNKYEVIISFNMDVELKANCLPGHVQQPEVSPGGGRLP
jgi:hypothetical protein